MRALAFLRFTLEPSASLETATQVSFASAQSIKADAGAQPLNGQAVQDLVGDGWLQQSADGSEIRIDEWPGFARRTEMTAIPSDAASLIRDLRRQAELALFGIGPLFETLHALDRLLRSSGPRTKPPS